MQQRFPADITRQAILFQSLFEGMTQRGTKLSADSALGTWGAKLATTLLDPQHPQVAPWENRAVPGLANPAASSPWGVTHRNSTDGNTQARYFDSIANGEHLTGVLTSAPFIIPSKLTYWMCGHNGVPGTNPPPVNHVRLRLIESGEIVAQEFPPRNDVARQYTWDLQKWAGQRGVFEAVDADTATGYAWLAVGRFEPEVVANPVEGFGFVDRSLVTAIQVAGQLQIEKLSGPVVALLSSHGTDTPIRIAAAQTGVTLNRAAAVAALIAVVQNATEPAALRTVAAQLLGPINTQPSLLALATALGTAPGPLQQPIALAMASTPRVITTANPTNPRIGFAKPTADPCSVSITDPQETTGLISQDSTASGSASRASLSTISSNEAIRPRAPPTVRIQGVARDIPIDITPRRGQHSGSSGSRHSMAVSVITKPRA